MHIVVNYYDPFSSVMRIPWVQDSAAGETEKNDNIVNKKWAWITDQVDHHGRCWLHALCAVCMAYHAMVFRHFVHLLWFAFLFILAITYLKYVPALDQFNAKDFKVFAYELLLLLLLQQC